jgi:hypothetical protein
MFRLRSLYHRGLLVARCSTISTLYSLASWRRPTHVYVVCPYVCAVHSRLIRIQPKVRLAEKGAPVLGERGVLAVPAHRRALHRSALSASMSLVGSSKGVDKSAGTSSGNVEWLRRKYHLVVLVRGWWSVGKGVGYLGVTHRIPFNHQRGCMLRCSLPLKRLLESNDDKSAFRSSKKSFR